MGIQSIAVDPNSNNQTIYVATGNNSMNRAGYGHGVFKSIDGGAHWSQTRLAYHPVEFQQDYNLYTVLMDPNNPNILWAVSDKKVYKTTDGFATVPNTIFTGGANSHFRNIAFKSNNTNIIYAAGGEIWKIVAGGTSSRLDILPSFTTPAAPAGYTYVSAKFSLSSTNTSTGIYVAANYTYVNNINPNTITTISRIRRYSELTNSWVSDIAPNISFSLWHPTFLVSPADPNVMYCETAGRNLGKSTDGGFTFNQITIYNGTYNGTYTHADIRAITLVQASAGGTADKLVVGNDGGVLYTNNWTGPGGTPIWTNINGTGLNITQFWGIGGTESDANLIIAGSQDNGMFTYDAGTWKVQVVGDAYDCAIDHVNDNIMFGAAYNGEYVMVKSVDGGSSWGGMAQPPGLRRTNRPLLIDNNNTWYVGYHDVFKSTNQGGTWTVPPDGAKISDFSAAPFNVPADDRLIAIAVAPSNTNVIYAAYGGARGNIPAGTLNNKIFKTTDGGGSWTDITPGLGAVTWTGISGIAIDPEDPDRIWVSFDSFWEFPANSGLGVNRVVYGHIVNGAWTWTDYSTGLPQFPVMSIVYQKGSDDGLYIGTDVGVYYSHASMPESQRWVCFSTNLPVGVVPDLEINYCAGKIRASSYGRGLWESPLAAIANAPGLSIASNTVWSGNTDLITDLSIEPDATLTVTGTINIASGKKIIVKRGAKLIVNGGTLTNSCGMMWEGIELWGNSSASQYTTGAQGEVTIQNGALIENARKGIITIRDNSGTWDWSYTGGIIRASNSTFRNCRGAIGFLYYHNFHPVSGTNSNNRSYITNCTFETTAKLNDPLIGPDAFISMYEVDMVGIYGNTFRNTMPVNAYPTTKRGHGIVSDDARYTLSSYCPSSNIAIASGQPCPNILDKNVFENLFYGVKASASYSFNTISISDAVFNNNFFGASLYNIDFPTIIRNEFNVSNYFHDDLPTTQYSYGLYLNYCTGYKVESNNFYSTYSGWVGTYINSSGSPSNIIYNNAFTNLYLGTGALNDNDGPGVSDGLRINCNDYTGNDFDISVLSMWGDPNTDIALNQGICNGRPQSLVRNTYGSCYFTDKSSTQVINHPNHPGAPFVYEPPCYGSLVIVDNCESAAPFNKQLECPSTLDCKSCPSFAMAQFQIQINALKATHNLETNSATRTQLEGEIGFYESERELAVNDRIRGYLNDPLMVNPIDSVIAILEEEDRPDAIYHLPFAYLMKKDYVKVQEMIDSLQQLNGMNNFCQLLNVMIQISQAPEGSYILKTDSVARQKVEEVAADSTSPGYANARSLLTHVFETYFLQETLLPGTGSSNKTAGIKETGKESAISCFPNPANESVTFAWSLPEGTSSASIKLYDATGKLIGHYGVSPENKQFNMKTNSLQGLFFYIFTVDEQPVSKGKLVIIK